MLLGKSASGQLINLAEPWCRKDLERIRKTELFSCPTCAEKVQLKLGTKRIWHFAHFDISGCVGLHEPESMYHLTAKRQLYNWLKEIHPFVEMEPYLKRLKQRPDLLLRKDSAIHAIEFQCSSIPDEILQKRTRTYRSHNIDPYWILGHTRLSNKSDCVFRMDDVAWNAIRCHGKNDPYLIYYSPRTQQFLQLQSIIPFSSRTVFASLDTQSLSNASFPLVTDLDTHRFPQSFIQPWKNLLQQTRMYIHLSRDPAVYSLKARFVEKGIPASLFPVEAGIPSKFLYWFQSPAYVWQSRFIIELIDPVPVGQSIDFQQVYRYFLNLLDTYKLKRRFLTIKTNSHISFAIMDYLNWLALLGVLKRRSATQFLKVRDIIYPSTIAEANQKLGEILKTISTN
ncbi:competence protein CoiA [Pseudalkalibacillus decolorationis]|uniref:competence protein CoiA n=1 Tax=Pseudalkalibacillus decolorationis TaxID=163879 RepID=UPI00214807B1|nr:competence protein CoiA family protein [Pseudalkalibacillus decolorationis]